MCIVFVFVRTIGPPVLSTTPFVVVTRVGLVQILRTRRCPSGMVLVGTPVTPRGRLTRAVFGPFPLVRPKVSCMTLFIALGWTTRPECPATGLNTVARLRHRRSASRTWLALIRFATVISGVLLRQVLVILAIRPAVLGLRADR